MWSRLVGSPMLRPATASTIASSLAFDRADDVDDVDMAPNEDAPDVLDSVVHLHDLPDHYAFSYFERDSESADVMTPSGVVVLNSAPVRPRVVVARRIVWKPVLGHDGLSGHRFDLLDANDELQAHIEVFVTSDAIQRVALVHRLFTPSARAAGLVDSHSLLEFNSPTLHLERLKLFLAKVNPGEIYLPTNELATGTDLDKIVEIDPRHVRNPSSGVAGSVWRHTVFQLRAISELAMQAAQQHNESEFRRCGLG